MKRMDLIVTGLINKHIPPSRSIREGWDRGKRNASLIAGKTGDTEKLQWLIANDDGDDFDLDQRN